MVIEMIELKNLYKIYKTKKKEECIAVNNISLTFEDRGLVFIIGKSGSGKTTLLGLIGGLDNISKGDILVNDISFKFFKYNDFVNYRNQMIGYVFQDFHLIDELTVAENIAISLDLQNLEYNDSIEKALIDVDLEGYGNRYPKELSGGEKQRVAIARALVKNPKIILADEPTGNLDTKTTSQILNLLKELSKERLVLMVSHNLNDATTYADRIIELSNGKVINDSIRNKEYCYECKIKDNELILPINKKITKDEINEINEKLSEGNIKTIRQTDDVFIKNNIKYDVVHRESIKITSNKYNFKKLLNLTFTFIKNDFFKLFIYSFLVSCLVVILGLSQLIVHFNPSEVIQNELEKIDQTIVSITKKDTSNDNVLVVDDTRLIDITEDDIQSFYQEGYNGEIYELVNVVLDYGTNTTLSHYHKPNNINPRMPFYNGTRGTLVTTEDYVTEMFGELKYVCLAKNQKDYGIFITDYTADAILSYSKKYFDSYESMLGKHKSLGVSYYAYVNGIIDTGYKNKYADVLEKFHDISADTEDLKKITESKEYLAYYDEVIESYSISYSFDPDFKEKFVNSLSRTWVPVGNSTLTINGIPVKFDSKAWFQLDTHTKEFNLNDNEIVLDYKEYNSMFNTNYSEATLSKFVPHNATFRYYHYYDELRTNALCELEVNIVALSTRSYVPKSIFSKLLEITTFTSSLYFSNIDDENFNFELIFDHGYEPNSVVAFSLSTMTKAVNVFSDFFNVIFIGLCICSLIILINYGIKLIKERKYEIGILKALGIKDSHLTFIFGCQILLLLIFVILLYFIGSILFIDLSNDILVTSLLEIAPNHFLMDIDVLYLKFPYMLQNSLLVALIVFISFIIPLVKLKTLKPTNIIKAKE